MKKNQRLLGGGKLSLQLRKYFLLTMSLCLSLAATNAYKASAASYLTELKIEDDNNVYWDRLLLMFDSTRYDFKDSYDAVKWTNPEVNFYTFSSDNQKLAIDCRPYAESKKIKAGLVTPYKQTYYLRVVQHNMPAGTCLCFRDNYADTTVTLAVGMKYYFTVNNDTLSQGGSRFEFICSKPYVAPPPPMTVSLTANPVYAVAGQSPYTIYTGYGAQSVTLSASVTDGKPGYTYSWSPSAGVDSPSAASVIVSPSASTTYTLTVRDANDSIKTISQTINVISLVCDNDSDKATVCHNGHNSCVALSHVPNHLNNHSGDYLGACLSVDAGIINVSCSGGSDGSISVAGTGAAAPYTYSWTNAAPAQGITGLSAGDYTVTIKSADGRTSSRTITVAEPSPLSVTTISVSNLTCNGGHNGQIYITGTGGTTPYSYTWNDNVTSKNRTGLYAGSYVVSVMDGKGCSSTASYTLTQPTAIVAGVSMSPLYTVQGQDSATIYRGYGPQSVTLSASVSGGAGGYTYKWSPASRVDNPDALTVVADPSVTTTYKLTVTDSNGCSESFHYRVYVVNAKCGSNSNPKVRVCYNDNNLCVDESAVPAYLQQGGLLGNCPSGSKGGNTEEENETILDDMAGAIRVYPNPSNAVFNIQLTGKVLGGELNVVDLQGRVVKQMKFGATSKIAVDMNNYPAGLYMIQMRSGNELYRLRVTLLD